MTDMGELAARLQSHSWRGRTWMWDIRDAIGHMSIAQVAMVGTHNTATYEITRKSKIGRDGPKALRNNGALVSFVCFFGGFFFPSWAKCQRMTVEEQLNFGVRYFDLRIAPDSALSTTLYTTHGLLSTKLEEVLMAVKTFVTEPATSHEFVLLDFQHIFLSPSDPGYATLFRSLVRITEICVHRPPNGERFPSLSELWKGQQRVFIFMNRNVDLSRLPFVCWRDSFLTSQWLNKHNKKDLLQALDQHAMQSPKTNAERVFLTQAIITPDRNTVLSGIFSLGVRPSSLRGLAKSANSDFMQWFWRRNTIKASPAGVHQNVLLLDYPELEMIEVKWDGGTLRGTVVDMCVCINLQRGLTSGDA
ncbi:putative variant-surface-glycoprotein phospholipase C [Leptomonas pyrrhocoris]|uniref:Putative variant-surface-glycoprotein phospholipase C n=1 Tax=Leptomonas pyrrhocoris TaxID=157538 RepID=A0A0M9G878_LEPPY|nr:putative variant-surface-glycoprotein phospholipase C [Leptomonas pyrrhocoris]XP_015662888.1 putative variant-surface-glycoprotein phospholipase C [Leptomonas pyrrhocoris]KPA84448.1 putative variant-surface-glycoprotein phospholipase C [Leptomonas pyrrhocoris]KPA84449.1 putative variant-surface-glycoprotein phospholipase C [Leptomonas pyrrhocoris]|eukprot:XP_015662887.1 putative variant-surface-glycoprotein phospholipase C [Leptomonas pyrrhocoris]